MKTARITVKVTLVNSQGFAAEDTVEETYPTDLSADEVKDAVKGFGRGFRNMMEVLRMNQATNGKPVAGIKAHHATPEELRTPSQGHPNARVVR